MKNLDYILKGLFGYCKMEIGEDEKIRLATDIRRFRGFVNVEKMMTIPILLKARGYKGDYIDNKCEVLRMVHPVVLDRACGFSISILDDECTYDFPDEYRAVLTLYKPKLAKTKQKEFVFEDIFEEFKENS